MLIVLLLSFHVQKVSPLLETKETSPTTTALVDPEFAPADLKDALADLRDALAPPVISSW